MKLCRGLTNSLHLLLQVSGLRVQSSPVWVVLHKASSSDIFPPFENNCPLSAFDAFVTCSSLQHWPVYIRNQNYFQQYFLPVCLPLSFSPFADMVTSNCCCHQVIVHVLTFIVLQAITVFHLGSWRTPQSGSFNRLTVVSPLSATSQE